MIGTLVCIVHNLPDDPSIQVAEIQPGAKHCLTSGRAGDPRLGTIEALNVILTAQDCIQVVTHSGALPASNTYNTCFLCCELHPRCFADTGTLLHTTSSSCLQNLHWRGIYVVWLWLVCCCCIAAAWINRDKSSQHKRGCHAMGTCQDVIAGSLFGSCSTNV